MTIVAESFDATKATDDMRLHVAVQTIRALRASGVDDPLAPYRADLRARLGHRQIGEREAHELLLLAEALTELASDSEATTPLRHEPGSAPDLANP